MSELVFPEIVSCEDELRPAVGVLTEHGVIDQFDAHDFIIDYLGPCAGIIPQTEFTINGSRIYFDDGPEISKPECRDPAEVVLYTRAADCAVEDALIANALSEHAKVGGTVVARYYRRNIDTNGNTWGCHDNISIPRALHTILSEGLDLQANLETDVLLKHLARRSFIAGAGMVTDRGHIRFAQKVDHLQFLVHYLELKDDEGHDSRLEIRCSDRSVKNATTALRIGSTTLVAAMLQTPLAARMDDNHPLDLLNDGTSFSRVKLLSDGTIRPSDAHWIAVDSEQRNAEYALGSLNKYMKVPEAYMAIAGMWYQYCEDFRSILRGEATIDLLSDRSNWAAMARLVLDYRHESTESARVKQAKSQMIDMGYGATTILVRGGAIGVKQGPGVRSQTDPSQPYALSDKAVAKALVTPPETRAMDRASRLRAASRKGYFIENATWRSAKVRTRPSGPMIFNPIYE